MTDLIVEAFACARCDAASFGFERPTPSSGYYKFPPTIGAVGPAPVLFVGINPRRSASNAQLHGDVMSGEQAFRLLSANRVPDRAGQDAGPYIHRGGPERHYDLHLDILEQAFGPQPVCFEEHAAVTELMLCATQTAPPTHVHPCAERFLTRTVKQVRPEVIIAVGAAVDGYLRRQTRRALNLAFFTEAVGAGVWVIPVPHPAAYGITGTTRRTAVRSTGQWIRDILNDGAPSERPSFTGQIADDWRRFSGEPSRIHETDRRWNRPTERREQTGGPEHPAWRAILAPGPDPPKGRLLAAHPDAQALTDELVRGLTVRKLVLLANVLHNRCRPPAAVLRSPEQHAGEVARAWRDVRLGMANMQMRDATAWTGTVKLLLPGAEAGLTVVGQLRIAEIVRVCQRVVAGPYSEAARRGLT